VESSPDASYDMAKKEDSDFSNWFERPVKIKEINWAVNGTVAQSFEPWEEWAKDPRIANRLCNFKNFRGKLHLKFTLNANQFYWGRVLVSYNPWNDTYSRIDSLVQCSQRPHLYLDPATSTGGELVLPFFHPDNAINMTLPTAFTEMGTLEMNSIGSLRLATGSRSITITVWAWCEDIVLSGPTQTNLSGLTAQAGKDEFGTGPVSKPASVVASMAGKLTKVPVIGKYAMATQIGAKALGQVAALFGYSRPAIISEPCMNRPLPAGNLACVDAPDTGLSFALTAKQEVTVDPTTVGLGSTDEMTMTHLASLESYYTSFTWDYTDVTGDLLYNWGVSPMAVNSPALGEYDMTSIAFAALPFRYWCGSITYRFQVIASGYHKGRMMICWDPVTQFSSGLSQTHTKYTHIVDISEERDFEITVGWGAQFPALQLPEIDDTSESSVASGFLNSKFNGSIGVYVLNDLIASSDTTQPITIAISIKSDDMHFYAPHEARLENLSYGIPPVEAFSAENLQAQAGIDQTDENQMNSDAIQPECENHLADLGKTGISTMQVPFCVGEEITSFRQCVKRYSQHAIHGAYLAGTGNVQTSSLYIHKQPAFPYMFGFDTDGVDTSGLNKCNRCTFTLLNYLSTAYGGWRGSLRWKIVPIEAPCCSWLMEARRCESNCNYEDNWAIYDPAAFADVSPLVYMNGVRGELQGDMQGGWDGSVVTATQHNPVLEFTVPYYNDKRFLTIPEHTATDSSRGMGWWLRFHATSLAQTQAGGNVAKSILFNSYVAAGEDFSFFFFRGAPRLYLTVL
jgi:hypothetical protein